MPVHRGAPDAERQGYLRGALTAGAVCPTDNKLVWVHDGIPSAYAALRSGRWADRQDSVAAPRPSAAVSEGVLAAELFGRLFHSGSE